MGAKQARFCLLCDKRLLHGEVLRTAKLITKAANHLFDEGVGTARENYIEVSIMKRVIVLGAGKIGTSVAKLLAESGDYRVTLVDAEQQALDRLEDRLRSAKKCSTW